MKPSRDPNIQYEPHLQKRIYDAQPDEAPFGMNVRARPLSGEKIDDVEHTVWDEPALSELGGKPPLEGLTYRKWLAENMSQWSQGKAWSVTLVVALLIAPSWAMITTVIGWVFSGGQYQHLHALGAQPLLEEICKIAVPLWIVEKRPYFFTGWFQIFFCALGSAALFAAMFLPLIWLGLSDFPNAPIVIFLYFLMHGVTGTLASIGLEKVWRRAIFLKERPQLTDGAVWFMSAYLVHLVWAVAFFIFQTLK